jgi:tetratricopeptide (TPR) repeat protein
MKYPVLLGLVFIAGIAATLRADVITVRGKENPVNGTIKSEDAKGVVVDTVEGKKKVTLTIPAGDVVDIVTDKNVFGTLGLTTGPYIAGQTAEKDAEVVSDPAKRKAAINLAIQKYDEVLKKFAPTKEVEKLAVRNLRYRIAMLSVKQVADPGTSALAVKRLQDFSKDYPDSWQIHAVMPAIAQLQLDNKDFDDAAKTFQTMADMVVLPIDVRREADLKVVEVTVKAGKIQEANKKLDALEAKAGKNPVVAARIKLARAEIFVGLKPPQPENALPLLQQVVKENNDKQIKALAHNALGEIHFEAKRYNEALWEFLWVDAVFNQDKSQHAKALYFLGKTFEQLNKSERAQECRDTLLNDRQFTGTEFQKRLIAETK